MPVKVVSFMNVRLSICPPKKSLTECAPPLFELSDNIENETDENTNNDAQPQGKVECEVIPLDENIAWKYSMKRQFLKTEQHEADYDQSGPEYDQRFRYFSHGN